VFTASDYICYLNWDGTVSGVIYFTEQDGEGTPFIYTASGVYGKTLLSRDNSAFYTFKTVDSKGNALSDASITNYQSYYLGGIIGNFASPVNIAAGFHAFPLKPRSRADAGLPNAISLPIRIQPES
jgi:hypothetical protein